MRIVVADDNKEIRSALGLVVQESSERYVGGPEPPQYSIVEAANAATLIGRLKEESCDVVLLDWELPGLLPGEMLAQIRHLSPGCKVVAMSGHFEARRHSLSLGADAFISKNEPPDRLLELLHLTPSAPNTKP